jgi:DNA-binding winged helix-turn-helix (wHTH) protein/TolB-like protein
MASDGAPTQKTGDLMVYSETGEVRNSLGKSVRLSPVNMKILKALVSRAGEVVLRSELFDDIWKNQSVSDDALTRCISDIRSELGKLSEKSKYIETIPKRGYRWNPDTGVTTLASHPLTQKRAGGHAADVEQSQPSSGFSKIMMWARRGLVYMVVLVAIASLGALLMEKFARPGKPIVVIMPTQSVSSQRDLADRIGQQISDYMVSIDQVDLLSRTAIQSRPRNPFPYFYHEFGARWLIESELRTNTEQSVLTIVLVDARAGIVLFQLTEQIPDDQRPIVLDVEHIFEPIRGFIDSQAGF